MASLKNYLKNRKIVRGGDLIRRRVGQGPCGPFPSSEPVRDSFPSHGSSPSEGSPVGVPASKSTACFTILTDSQRSRSLEMHQPEGRHLLSSIALILSAPS